MPVQIHCPTHRPSWGQLIKLVPTSPTYRIAGNFRGAIFSWISWFETCARKFYPRIPEPRPFMKQCADSYHENIITHLLRNTKILSLENYPLDGSQLIGVHAMHASGPNYLYLTNLVVVASPDPLPHHLSRGRYLFIKLLHTYTTNITPM